MLPNVRMFARVPPLPPRHVSRPRLLAALDVAAERALTLIAAGPGAGKTVLLSDWVAQRRPAAAWVSLDSNHNHPARFWSTIGLALRDARYATVQSRGVTLARGDGEAIVEPFVAAVEDEPIVLVLDDAHVINNSEVLHGLDECIRRWGAQLKLIVATRADPVLPLHSYRAAGDMAELRAADLAMSAEESTRLLDVHGVHLSPRDFELLSERTEGWVAGIRLSAMRMEGTRHPGDFVGELALDQGSIGEYLMEEVLDRQPCQVRQLLIDTSFLDEVSGSLAQAVTGLAEAPSMLTSLSRTNSFVLPTADHLDSFRYHQLLSEILRYLLRRESIEHQRRALGRAARWYEAAGDWQRSLRYGSAARDWNYVAQTLVLGGFANAVEHRLDLTVVSPEQLADQAAAECGSEPILLAAAAAMFALGRKPEQARRCLDLLAALGQGVQRSAAGIGPTESELIKTVALTELLIARTRLDIQAAQPWAGNLIGTAEPALAAAARFELAMTCFYACVHKDVDGLLSEALSEARAAGSVELELDCLAELAHVHAFWGHYVASAAYDRQATLLLRRRPGLAAPPSLFVAVAGRANARMQVGDALNALRRASALATDDRTHELRDEIAVTESLLHSSAGHFVEARRALAKLDSNSPGLVGAYQSCALATIETGLGRPNAAVNILRSHRSARLHCINGVAMGRALLARGDLDGAAAALRPIVTGPTAPFLRAVLVEAFVADAQIAQAQGGHEAQAVRSLERAVDWSEGEFVLPLARANDVLAEIRGRSARLALRWPVPTSLETPGLETLETSTEDLGSEHPLTERERAVLRWLSTTMTVNEIASELCLSLNTVKTHIAAIYRKLAVERRRDAVARARSFELL